MTGSQHPFPKLEKCLQLDLSDRCHTLQYPEGVWTSGSSWPGLPGEKVISQAYLMSLPERRFGWSDMFLNPQQGPRTDGGFHTERETLIGFLRDQRLTLELKCSGLDAAALASRSVPPSNLSLLGLVRHLAGVEQTWFRNRMAGGNVPRHFRTPEDRDGDFNGARADPELIAEAWRVWREEVAFAEQYVDQALDLGLIGKSGDPLREVMVHMIEEYARHNGHADLIRERIDGRVGQ